MDFDLFPQNIIRATYHKISYPQNLIKGTGREFPNEFHETGTKH